MKLSDIVEGVTSNPFCLLVLGGGLIYLEINHYGSSLEGTVAFLSGVAALVRSFCLAAEEYLM